MSLKNYRAMRDFATTPEPKTAKHKSGFIYCIQKHDARRLHYDLRLQLGGVLKSWAVPNGPSLDPKQKRLAIEVEDHPVDYARFEGVIPEGYGAGEVLLWDIGTWKPLKNPRLGIKKGLLEFEIFGQKLHGKWVLVRTRKIGTKNQWLLIKRTDDAAQAESDFDVLRDSAGSVKSGRLLTARAKPKFVEPQLAQLAKAPPAGEQWLHEIKFDGYRTMCLIDGKDISLLTRKGLNWTKKYPGVLLEAKKIKVKNALIDGELVALDGNGRSDFQKLQAALKSGSSDFYYYVFDLLFLNGRNLQTLPLSSRKEVLKDLIKKSGLKHIIFSEHIDGHGKEFLQQCCERSLEGIVSKDRDAPYSSGRGGSWIKTKCTRGQEFVIVGFTRPQGSRTGFGALLLAARDKKNWRYVGRVGTGFTEKKITDLMSRFQRLRTSKSPIAGISAKNVTWLKPKLVAEIAYSTWTRDGLLRHPSFRALREDKPPEDVSVDSERIEVTNPKKIFFPKGGFTKEQMAQYYWDVRTLLLPHAANRPLSLVRCPNGIDQPCFYQKKLGRFKSRSIFEKRINEKNHSQSSLLFVENELGLMELVQLGVVEIHVWGSHINTYKLVDQIVLDLDPDPSLEWQKIADAALFVRELLHDLKIESFVKSTGGKGLHVQFPVQPDYGWEQAKAFTKTVAEYMSQKSPELFLSQMTKSKRRGKIFVDYLRNAFGATAVTPYSLRARTDAGLAVPLQWSDLGGFHPGDVTLKNGLKFIRGRTDPWKDYFTKPASLSFE